MKKYSFIILILFASIVISSCENLDDKKHSDTDAELALLSTPENPCCADNDNCCHGHYKASISGINGELTIVVQSDHVTATLSTDVLTEEFTSNSEITEAALENGITLKSQTNNNSFQFKVNPDGTAPTIDLLEIQGENDLYAIARKATTSEYVDIFTGEIILTLRPHPSVTATKTNNTLIFDFGTKEEVFEVPLSGESFLYEKDDIKIEGIIKDNIIISGWYWAPTGGVEFNMVNRSYFNQAETIITDQVNDVSPYSIPGADIKEVTALQTQNLFALQIICNGNMSQFWFDNVLPEGFPSFGIIMADNKSYGIERDNAFRWISFSTIEFNNKNFVVRDKHSFYLIVDKQWAIYEDNEVEFYVAAYFLPERSLDRTKKVIIKLL